MSNNNIDNDFKSAVFSGNLEEVKRCLVAGAYVNMRVVSWPNNDPLLHCCRHVEIVKELLLRGARVNETNKYGRSVLHSAVERNYGVEVFRELLKNKAYVNATDRKGNTPLNLAAKKSSISLDIVKELLKYGADINIRNSERRLHENCNSPLQNAVYWDKERAELLIKFTAIKYFEKNYKKFVNLDSIKDSRNYGFFLNYLEKCVLEIVKMKMDEMSSGLPLYNLVCFYVTNNLSKNLLGNNSLSVRLTNINYSTIYPIYHDIILDAIEHFIKRAGLLKKISSMQICAINSDLKRKSIILDPNSVHYITEYLSNDDLTNLTIVLNDSTDCCIQSSSSFNDNLVEPDGEDDEASTSRDAKRARLI